MVHQSLRKNDVLKDSFIKRGRYSTFRNKSCPVVATDEYFSWSSPELPPSSATVTMANFKYLFQGCLHNRKSLYRLPKVTVIFGFLMSDSPFFRRSWRRDDYGSPAPIFSFRSPSKTSCKGYRTVSPPVGQPNAIVKKTFPSLVCRQDRSNLKSVEYLW